MTSPQSIGYKTTESFESQGQFFNSTGKDVVYLICSSIALHVFQFIPFYFLISNARTTDMFITGIDA